MKKYNSRAVELAEKVMLSAGSELRHYTPNSKFDIVGECSAGLNEALKHPLGELGACRDILIELRDKHLCGAAAIIRALVQKRIDAIEGLLKEEGGV